MAVTFWIAGPLQSPAPTLWTTPSLSILILLTVAIVVVVYAQQPPIPETIALPIVLTL